MKKKLCVATFALVLAGISFATGTRDRSRPPKGSEARGSSPAQSDEAERVLEGEQRFRTNCGRCHIAPHKFPPRMMSTIVRHMRVRATLTDEDMRLILEYLTQ